MQAAFCPDAEFTIARNFSSHRSIRPMLSHGGAHYTSFFIASPFVLGLLRSRTIVLFLRFLFSRACWGAKMLRAENPLQRWRAPREERWRRATTEERRRPSPRRAPQRRRSLATHGPPLSWRRCAASFTAARGLSAHGEAGRSGAVARVHRVGGSVRARPGRACSATAVTEAAAELRGGSVRDPGAGSLGRRRREIRPRELHHGGAKVSGKPRARFFFSIFFMNFFF